MTKPWIRTLIVLAFALTGPTMLAVDFFLRHFILGSQPADVRGFLADHLTPFAWCVVPLPVIGGIFGYRMYSARFRKSLARWQKDTTLSPDVASQRADFEALFLSTSLAQLPAVLGDLSIILGASVVPALCSTVASATAVLLIGLRGNGEKRRAD